VRGKVIKVIADFPFLTVQEMQELRGKIIKVIADFPFLTVQEV
jgi:hypothetical protein